MSVWRRQLALPIALALAGCADPGGAFDAFADRYRKTHATGGDAGLEGDGGICTLPDRARVEGLFALVVSPAFSPKTPIVFLDAVSASAPATDRLDIGMTLTALSAVDRKTPVGTALPSVSAQLGAGPFSFDLGVLEIVGEADPVIPGAAITATVVLDGELCDAADGGEIDFLCGNARGQVTAPAELGLTGSTWTLTRVAANGELPDLVINCAKDAPNPL